MSREDRLLSCSAHVAASARDIFSRIPRGSGIEISDLESEAWIAILRCYNRFDESKGFKFKTLADKRIRGAMLDYVRKVLGRKWDRVLPISLDSTSTIR